MLRLYALKIDIEEPQSETLIRIASVVISRW